MMKEELSLSVPVSINIKKAADRFKEEIMSELIVMGVTNARIEFTFAPEEKVKCISIGSFERTVKTKLDL